MSELILYDNCIETKFYVELFFVGINPPEIDLSPIFGPKILKSRLMREMRLKDKPDYIIPINLLDIAGKSYAEIIKLDFVKIENGIVWGMTLCFEFIDDVKEFFYLKSRNHNLPNYGLYANYYINLQFEGKEDVIKKVDEEYISDLEELSKICNSFALKEKSRESANMLFMLDYIFSEASEGGGELIDYCNEPTEDDKSFCDVEFVINFEKYKQFKNFAEQLVKEDHNTSSGMIS